MGGAGKLLLALQRDGLCDRRSDTSSARHTRRQTAEELDVGVMFGAETGFSGERVSPLVDAATRRAGLAWFVTSLLALVGV